MTIFLWILLMAITLIVLVAGMYCMTAYAFGSNDTYALAGELMLAIGFIAMIALLGCKPT